MMERAHVWVWHDRPGEKQQENRGNHRHLRSFVASQTHSQGSKHMGNREQGGQNPLSSITAEPVCKQQLLQWEPIFVPWWFAIAVIIAA